MRRTWMIMKADVLKANTAFPLGQYLSSMTRDVGESSATLAWRTELLLTSERTRLRAHNYLTLLAFAGEDTDTGPLRLASRYMPPAPKRSPRR